MTLKVRAHKCTTIYTSFFLTLMNNVFFHRYSLYKIKFYQSKMYMNQNLANTLNLTDFKTIDPSIHITRSGLPLITVFDSSDKRLFLKIGVKNITP